MCVGGGGDPAANDGELWKVSELGCGWGDNKWKIAYRLPFF